MNEGQGQDDVIRAEDDRMSRVSNGDCKQMKARRQGELIYFHTFNSQRQFKVVCIMH